MAQLMRIVDASSREELAGMVLSAAEIMEWEFKCLDFMLKRATWLAFASPASALAAFGPAPKPRSVVRVKKLLLASLDGR
jgi:hypothetical protein